ncbi:MAG TPA: hypothetical protein VF099_03455 [Ktedonobacterales bacterium]
MAQGQAQFCGACGSPRVPGASGCPNCHSPYTEPPGSSLASVQEPTQVSPTVVVSSLSQPNWNTPAAHYAGAQLPEQPTQVPPPPGGYTASGLSVAPPPAGYSSSGPSISSENPTQVVGSQPVSGPALPEVYPSAVAPTPPPSGGKPRSGGKLVIANSIAIVILFVVVVGLLYHDFLGTGTQASIAPTATSAPGSLTSGTNPTGTAATGATATRGANPTATTPASLTGYTASLPGPGCDTRGGIWTPRGLDGISCPTQSGTALVINATGARGYLYLQLPNNQAFAPNNTLSITATLGENGNGYQAKCVGLAEVDANTGFSAEFCNTGQWFIYSISSDGSILQTLDKNVSNTLTSAKISLTISGSTLTFSVNSTPADAISIMPIQPARVAIVYDCVGYGAGSTIGGNYLLVNGFVYSPASS